MSWISTAKCLAILYWLTTRPTQRPILSCPASRPASTRCLIFARLFSVALQQALAFVRPQLGQLRIAAGNQPFARIIGMRHLEQVAIVEQIGLQRLVFDQGADRAALECRDPVDAILGLELVDGLL